MDDEEYDILPHKEVLRLKQEAEALKGAKPATQEAKSRPGDLKSSIDNLNNSIQELLQLFKTAGADITAEEIRGPETFALGKKLDTLINHNEDMAKALLLLLELSREHLPKLSTGVKQKIDAPQQQYPPQQASSASPFDMSSFSPLDIGLPEPPRRPMNANPARK